MSIAVTGATGQLGRLVVNGLKAKVAPETVVAIARAADKASNLGVAVRTADYSKPETLGPAFDGIDTLLLISGNEVGKRAEQHSNVIDAAKKAGVKRIVYTSLLRAESSPLDLAPEHLATELSLKASGVPYTILRNGWYTENYTGSLGGALANGAIHGSAGSGKISSAARADYAEAAVAVLSGSGHEGKVYELAGDDSWTLAQLAEEVSRQTGQIISCENHSEGEYVALLTTFGLPEGLAQAIAGWDVAASQGALFDDSRQLSTLIGHPTTPLNTTVAEALREND